MSRSNRESQDYDALFHGYEQELTHAQQHGGRSIRNQGNPSMSNTRKHSPGSARHSGRYSAHDSFVQEEMGEISIEADGDFDSAPIDVDDEDLNAAFEAEHAHFRVIDEIREGLDDSRHAGSLERESERKKFVIPKLRVPENESQYESNYNSDEENHDWRKSDRDKKPRDHEVGRRERGDRDAGKRDHRDSGRRERDDRDRRDNREGRGERERYRGENNSQSSQVILPENADHEERQSLFESFAMQGLISENPIRPDKSTFEQNDGMEGVMSSTEQTKETVKDEPEKSHLLEEDDTLEIPMGRDTLVFCRDYYTWQIRMHPVYKADIVRADFAQMWGMAESSSVAWSDHNDFGGVIEFLLKEVNSIQKFMRKILWHSFLSDLMTVEVTERTMSELSQQNGKEKLDIMCNRMVFKYSNTRARQLIKTYYPTPQGEVTERSVYVNNVNSGKAVNLLRAVFPCSAKISVARNRKESSTALVETSSVEEAFNYLVVYQQIKINESDVLLCTVNNDWEGARKQFEKKFKKPVQKKETGNRKPAESSKPAVTTQKRTSDGGDSSRPAKRGRGAANLTGRGGFHRHRSGVSRSGGSQGKGGALLMGRGAGRGAKRGSASGRALLPNPPMGAGDGLLPLPPPPPPPKTLMGGNDGLLPAPDSGMRPPSLLALPVKPTPKGLIEGELLGPPEPDMRMVDLKEIRQELESRVLQTRAQLESHLSQLDQAYRATEPSKPHRPVDYLEEEERRRDPPRRPLLPAEGRSLLPAEGRPLLSVEGRPRMEEEAWREEQVYASRPARRPQPLISMERGYEVGPGYGRERREEDYGDIRSSSSHPRPYLLDAPRERGDGREAKDRKEVFDYEHSERRNRVESDVRRAEPRSLLGRPPAVEPLDRDRREYSEERAYRARDVYNYEELESRRPQAYGAYEEENRRLAGRYRDEYDSRY